MGWLPFISTSPHPPTQESHHSTVKPKLLLLSLLLLFSLLLLLFLLIFHLSKADTRAAGTATALSNKKPTRAISHVCSSARFPSLCITSLLDFPHSESASESTLPSLYINLTLHHFGRALFSASDYSGGALSIHPPPVRSALSDCLELLEDAVHLLSDSLDGGTSPDDTTTWLSAALTNQDTCMEGLQRVGGHVMSEIGKIVGELSQIARNCLSIHVSYANMEDGGEAPGRGLVEGGDGNWMPLWLKKKDRRLLETPAIGMQADIVVSWRGENGTVKTIKEGIRMAPENSRRRIVIYVKAGRYEEKDLKVGRKKTNVMLIGDGKGVTVISGGKNVLQNITTFHTASFAVTGGGFMARDMTFENWAGPAKHQAVALRVGADHAVIYRCNIIGYQDSLYAHSQRQFFRECDIYGTVDFIFGNAAAVFQNCSLYARPPLPSQKNTVVAQGRKDPSQNTGFSIQGSRILATADYNQNNTNTTTTTATTYLGRPWKQYSRVVYMQSYMGSHLHPRGWLEWNASGFALDTLYFGEYVNYGPGSITDQRVNWTGYRIIDSTVEAGLFTVASFISGQSWLPSTGVAYQGGLTL